MLNEFKLNNEKETFILVLLVFFLGGGSFFLNYKINKYYDPFQSRNCESSV